MMFEESPLWDLEKKYNPTSIRMYYEHRESGKLYVVDPNCSLKEVLSQKTYFFLLALAFFVFLIIVFFVFFKGTSFKAERLDSSVWLRQAHSKKIS